MISSTHTELTKKIKAKAHEIGFDLIGIARPRNLDEHQDVLNKWISEGMNADMHYLGRDIHKRTDPSFLLDGVKSVIVTGSSYFPSERQGGDGIPVLSKYAYGKDYHVVIGEKLNKLFTYILSLEPEAKGRVCVDSSPILEKAWAKEAGIGWPGRNSIVINKDFGSFIFLGEILLDIELGYDKPYPEDLCGNCNLCRNACPTRAINDNRTINSNKCISWLTLENKNEIPEEFNDSFNDKVYGCDICQDACPYNKNAICSNNPDFRLSDNLKNLKREDFEKLTFEHFDKIFENSSIKRLTYKRFMRNINYILSEK
jgi:epoxyqueuosine reductase